MKNEIFVKSVGENNPGSKNLADYFAVGTRIISIFGESADTDEGQDVFTGLNAEGLITEVLLCQEHCYGVDFPLGVSVFLSPADLAESKYYQVVHRAVNGNLHNVHIYAIVRVTVANVEAESHPEAIIKAEGMVNLHSLFDKGPGQEFAEDIDCFLVDEVGEGADFMNSRWYRSDGVTKLDKPHKAEIALPCYRVTLFEHAEDSETIVFECEAEDIRHAIEQAENAYPAATVIGAVLMKP
jgi:hypothetical protein